MVCKLIDYTKMIKNKLILDNVNLELEANKIYGIIGHNGSGKTMLLRAICGLIQPSSGERIIKSDINFGIVLENPTFFNHLTALENLEYLASIKSTINKDKIIDIIKQFGLEEVKDKKVRTFSLGMKQKMGIAQAIMENQNLVLLDEPFNALDEKSRFRVKEIIIEFQKQTKSTIVIVSHYKEELMDMIDELIYIENSKVSIVDIK